jgi:capsular polysaccharide biosynthesis protein
MSQQALDLRRSTKIVWRHKILVAAVMVLGILAGGAHAWFNPPTMASTALVVLPQPPQNVQVTGGNGGPDPFTATQEVIAGSNKVLAAALPDVRPAMSLPALRRNIQVGSLTPEVISITAKGKNAADAESTANAVANSYVQYVNSSKNPAEHVTADVLEQATSATGSAPLKQLVLEALLGGIAGLLAGAVIALAIGRNDRRLRERDEIADSIGVPVLASFPVVHPADAAGWIKLLDDYKPGARNALQLQQALHHLGMAVSANNSNGSEPRWSSVAILSLSSDPGGLALGPHLAAFAASQGIPTALVIGPQQDPATAATLRTACAVPPPSSSNRPSHLRIAVSDDVAELQLDTTLTVIVSVVDSRSPRMPDMIHTTATLLAVSSGAATAEQLARMAVSADANGHEVTGILVADPEPTDRTTGRIPQLPRPLRRKLPTRLTGMVTEITR